MRAFQLLPLASLSLLTLSNRCDRQPADEACPTGEVTCTQIADAVSGSCFGPTIGTTGTTETYVINSAAELSAALPCVTQPAVDFGTYTLLLGHTTTSSCSHVLTQRVTRTCGNYRYSVRLAEGVCTAVTRVTYHVLVPKLPAGAAVEFVVETGP